MIKPYPKLWEQTCQLICKNDYTFSSVNKCCMCAVSNWKKRLAPYLKAIALNVTQTQKHSAVMSDETCLNLPVIFITYVQIYTFNIFKKKKNICLYIFVAVNCTLQVSFSLSYFLFNQMFSHHPFGTIVYLKLPTKHWPTNSW